MGIGTGSDEDEDGDDDDHGEGGLSVRPGDTLRAGYAFTLPGKHASATISFSQATVTLQAVCHRSHHHRGGGPIVVSIADASYPAAQNSSAWVPSRDQNDASVFQGSTTVPDLCQGGSMRIRGGGTFTAMVGSQ